MNIRLGLLLMLVVVSGPRCAVADLIISQYVETSSGFSPKGIEIWNSSSTAIDFSATPLSVFIGVNGTGLSNQPGAGITTGTLPGNAVLVIGTSDIGSYLTATFGAGVVQYHEFGFTFNGDDALQILLGSIATDTFGNPGSDPGAAWTGSTVSTANQNIALKPGILTGNADGFIDPSLRYQTVSTDNSLTGFGVAPAAVPEASAFLFGGLISGVAGLWSLRQRRRRVDSAG